MSYSLPDLDTWNGRSSHNNAYFHEVITCVAPEHLKHSAGRSYALLGYACDEGVRRNLGRVGARKGPEAVRKYLAAIPNHLHLTTEVYDLGDIKCNKEESLEAVQEELSEVVSTILSKQTFPILMGGGHDIAWGHYLGITNYLQSIGRKGNIGIVNLDAHFDLRQFAGESTSGTPFMQIAQDCEKRGAQFKYLCMGIQKLCNTPDLYVSARQLGVSFLEAKDFREQNFDKVQQQIIQFVSAVDHVYLTIDLDGFAASISPGVSAPSPFGFEVNVVLKVIDELIASGKLISCDMAEINPNYDKDGRTAKLTAYLIAYLLHTMAE